MSKTDKIEFFFERGISWTRIKSKNLKLLFDTSQKKELGLNKKYKNAYKGQRCFIVGNGPSLKKQDLTKIKDEKVFTVNYLFRSPIFEQVKSDFHVMLDVGVFDFKRQDSEEIKLINNANPDIVCFFPYGCKQSIDNVGLSQKLNISYVASCGLIYENFNEKIDMTRCMYGYCTVVQYAITFAIYMGFSEIYLLGCDMTGYEEFSAIAGKAVSAHAYEMSEKDKETLKVSLETTRSERFFKGFYRMFMDYRRLYEYAQKKHVKLFNATDGGVLDNVPRVDYDSLF